MPEWAEKIVMALIVAATGGTAWLFKSWREDKNKRLEAQAAYVAGLEARNEKLIEKVQSLLVDAKVEALENKAERAKRLEMDAGRLELDSRMVDALKEATAARLKGHT